MSQGAASLVTGNRLLSAIGRTERATLTAAADIVTFDRGQSLMVPGTALGHVILPDRGLISIMVELPGASPAEANIVGADGVIGLAALFGVPQTPVRAVVRVPGSGYRIPVETVQMLAERSTGLREALRLQMAAALLHAAVVAACNATHPLERRVARWLVSAADRVGPGFPLTQDELATILGARRPTVNTVLLGFRGAGLIRQTRGRVEITDRARLTAVACPCHAALRFPLPDGRSPSGA